MNKEKALQIIQNVLSSIRATKEEHNLIDEAVDYLASLEEKNE